MNRHLFRVKGYIPFCFHFLLVCSYLFFNVCSYAYYVPTYRTPRKLNPENTPGMHNEKPNFRVAYLPAMHMVCEYMHIKLVVWHKAYDYWRKFLGGQSGKKNKKKPKPFEKRSGRKKIENSVYFSPAACACQNKFFSWPALLSGCPPPFSTTSCFSYSCSCT